MTPTHACILQTKASPNPWHAHRKSHLNGRNHYIVYQLTLILHSLPFVLPLICLEGHVPVTIRILTSISMFTQKETRNWKQNVFQIYWANSFFRLKAIQCLPEKLPIRATFFTFKKIFQRQIFLNHANRLRLNNLTLGWLIISLIGQSLYLLFLYRQSTSLRRNGNPF